MVVMAAILDLLLERFYLFLNSKSPWCFLPSFKSVGILVQEKKRTIDFQGEHKGEHLGFPTEGFKGFFLSMSPWCFLRSLESIGLSVQEKKRKIDFQDGSHGGHLGFPIRMILAILILVILMLPSKFQDKWSLVSREEAKTRFSRWWPSWLSHPNNFSYFSYQVSC